MSALKHTLIPRKGVTFPNNSELSFDTVIHKSMLLRSVFMIYLHLSTDLSISSVVRSLVSQGRMYLLISRKVIT